MGVLAVGSDGIQQALQPGLQLGLGSAEAESGQLPASACGARRCLRAQLGPAASAGCCWSWGGKRESSAGAGQTGSQGTGIPLPRSPASHLPGRHTGLARQDPGQNERHQ